MESALDLNHVRDCEIIVLSRCYFFNKNLHKRFLSVIDDLSLMAMDRNVEYLAQETNTFGAALLQTLSFEVLYRGRREN